MAKNLVIEKVTERKKEEKEGKEKSKEGKGKKSLSFLPKSRAGVSEDEGGAAGEAPEGGRFRSAARGLANGSEKISPFLRIRISPD